MKSLDNKKKVFLKIPKATDALETYKAYAKHNVVSVFTLDNDIFKHIPVEWFLENKDHGAEHTHNVFKKSLEIVQRVETETALSVDKTLLYIMSGMHDSGRFRLPMLKENETTRNTAKEQKRKKAESEHASYGVAQIKLWFKKLKEKDIELSLEEQQKIEDYILNHDFFNERLDGKKYHEPMSIEGQITRLADRISTPIQQEVERYRETGKRLGAKYFNNNITWQERIDFSFANMKTYITSGKFDEFTFFLSLLAQKSSDFSHPVLAEIYQQWATSKRQGIDSMLHIAKAEWYNDENLQQMKDLIDKYLEHFDIRF